jgi:Holliday junction DNA helicase RuvA
VDGLVLDVGGVGYLVAATPSALRRADGVTEVTVETYLHVRDDVLQLYGFADAAERALARVDPELPAEERVREALRSAA